MADGIELEGLEEALKQLGTAGTLDALEAPMHRTMFRLQRAMAVYPPPPSGSRYRRSGSLGRRWTTQVYRFNGDLVGKVGNNTLYGPYVQSEQFQAHWMTHWQTDQEVINREKSTIINDFERAINDAVGG